MPQFVAGDGAVLWYDVVGAGEPLLVLPGGPGMDARYLGDLGGLHRHRRLVRLHPRGTGRSATPGVRETVAFTAQANDVEALRRHLEWERMDLLAHSAGCLTAQEYAAAYPGRLRRAVLVAPVGRAQRETDAAELAALHDARAGEPWYPAAIRAERALAAGSTGEQGPTGGVDAAELARRIRPFAWYRWTGQRHGEYRAAHACRHSWYRQAFYAGSATPDTLGGRLARLAGSGLRPLVIAGAADGLVGVAPAHAVAECHPGSRLAVLERSGHRPWVEEPESFRELVLQHLHEPAAAG